MITRNSTIPGFNSCKFLFAEGQPFKFISIHFTYLQHVILYQDYSSATLPAMVFSVTLEFDIPTNYHSEHG